ncbi:hypothetical protein [Edaphosphingomonas haloaromaticamans]|uniref:Uncharacterized protein n=1 Tax=Edaphosphingomonas haloaromaticamans TaxID=653954 RepID=A0A1S1HAE5_9SPHN|nr:hypothetical protein [Sphingomonas haloaromaticamans]OHT19048.1 hypothetical protein BHE75_01030 [Sphingomonas haloaromaticamans]
MTDSTTAERASPFDKADMKALVATARRLDSVSEGLAHAEACQQEVGPDAPTDVALYDGTTWHKYRVPLSKFIELLRPVAAEEAARLAA